MKNKNSYKSVLGMVIILYVLTIILFKIVNEDREFSESENRRLELRPKMTMSNIMNGKFTQNYESYISDQFPFRDAWIGVKSTSEKLLGKRENNGVYLADDGYLMERFIAPTEEEFLLKIDEINSLMSGFHNRDKYFLLVPNSNSILEEKLPKYAPNDDQMDYISRVKDLLDVDIKLVDPSEELYRNREENIYYKTDHHWTTKGSYIGYKRLMDDMGIMADKEEEFNIERVTDSFYGSLYSKSGFRNLDPDSIEIYRPKEKCLYTVEYVDQGRVENSIYNMESLEEKDKYKLFLQGNHPLIKIQTESDSEEKLLIIKDSYANSMIPFLINHFSEIHIVDKRYYTGDMEKLVENGGIDRVLVLYNVNSLFSLELKV